MIQQAFDTSFVYNTTIIATNFTNTQFSNIIITHKTKQPFCKATLFNNLSKISQLYKSKDNTTADNLLAILQAQYNFQTAFFNHEAFSNIKDTFFVLEKFFSSNKPFKYRVL